jgi:hypothetical protein
MYLPEIISLQNKSELIGWHDFFLKEHPQFSRLNTALSFFPIEMQFDLFQLWQQELPPYILSDVILARLLALGCKIPEGEILDLGLKNISWQEFEDWRGQEKFSLKEMQRRIFQAGASLHAIALPESALPGAEILKKHFSPSATVWDFLECLILLEATRLPKIAIRMHT